MSSLPLGWRIANVHFQRTNGAIESRFEIINENRYRNEPMEETAHKCAVLFFMLPLYFISYTAFHLIRLPIVTLANASPRAFINQIWAIARIPFYFIGLEMAALVGIFKPLEGRALFGSLERDLHDGKRVRVATDFEKKLGTKFFWEVLSRKDDPHAFFTAPCMQSYGKTSDPHIMSVQ